MFTTQTACVARHSEPIFCPNAGLPLSLPGAALDRHPLPIHYNVHYDYIYDDDDDEHEGGVALSTNHDNELPTDEPNEILMTDTPVHNTSDAYIASNTLPLLDRFDSRHDARAVHSTEHDLRRRDHPRPETSEIREEEDGRRLRLPLQGRPSDGRLHDRMNVVVRPAAISSSDLHGRGSVASSRPPSSRATPNTLSTNSSRTVSRRTSYQNVSSHVQTMPAREADASSIQYSNANQMTPTHAYEDEMELDDDAMPVDDPRRNYDFADFMDSWRLRSMHDKRLPKFEPGLQSSIRIGRSDHPVTRKQVRSQEVDMQGLRWKLIGPSRCDANTARDMLHPSRSTSSYMTHSQPHPLAEEERLFSFRSFLPGRRARFNHYQLRNVLTACNRNTLLYAAGNEVKQASLSCPSTDETVMDLSSPANCAAGFRITCLSATETLTSSHSTSSPVLLAGGFYGEYAVLNLSSPSNTPSEGYVTHAYNGLVTHIHDYPARRSGLTQAVFCSNDCKVRIMDVRRLQFTNTFSYEHAINCAATSPDRRLRVLVGDSQETLITDAERGTTLVTLKEHTDHAFACDWSPCGRYVATGAQDGTVLVWDARNWAKPLNNLPSAMTCARSLTFTDDGALIAAENDDVVRIYDKSGGGSGSYNAWQEIRFFGSVAGVAVLEGGEEVVVSNADRTAGGLLTFERTPKGRGEGGTYGRRLKGGSQSWRCGREVGGAEDVVDELHF